MGEQINKKECPICRFPEAPSVENPRNDTYRFNCPRCKTFFITEEAMRYTDIKENILKHSTNLSGLSRLLAETGGEPFTILTKNIEEIASTSLAPDQEDILKKGEVLLEAIRRRTTTYGKSIKLEWEKDYPLAFAANVEEFIALLNFLEERGKIELISKGTMSTSVSITAEGWLKKKSQQSEQGFIAAWFDKEGSMDEIIRKTEDAIRECDYHPMCIKEEHYPETILDKAIGEIRGSRFIIVNLTNERNSVFFEAGYAHGVGLDVIYVCDEKYEKIAEFYSKHYKIYFYKDAEDLKNKLIDVIKARIL